MAPRVPILCALFTSLGCGTLIGDYRAAGGGGAGGADVSPEGGPRLPDFEPGLPYLAAPDCVACMDERCTALAEGCAADSKCAALRTCRQRCFDGASNDPACHDVCLGQNSLDSIGALEECVAGSCRSECRLGEDFSCVGAFDRNRAHEGESSLDIHFRLPMLPPEDASVFEARAVSLNACAPLFGACRSPEATVAVPAGGDVDITVPTLADGYRGYFFVEQSGNGPADAGPDGDVRPLYIGSSWPFGHAAGVFRYLVAESVTRGIIEGVGYAYDPGAAYATFLVSDCNLARSWGVRVEVTEPCEAPCAIAYYANGSLDTTLTETTASPIAQAGIAYAPTRALRINAIHVETGRLVASYPWTFVPGALGSIELRPLSRADAELVR